MEITYLLIAVTALVSLYAFSNQSIIQKFILYPVIMNRPSEYYRLVTSGFIHADWNHLIFNMLTLYFFGINAEYILDGIMGPRGNIAYIVFYLSAIALASLPAMAKHKNNQHYAALGASGGVSAILFFVIYYSPWTIIRVYFFPIPAIIYAVLYIAYSYFMNKRGMDNIGHDAHLGGALYGALFAFLVDPSHGKLFFYLLTHPSFN